MRQLWILVALVCLYVLSIGPQVYLSFIYPESERYSSQFYRPLYWAVVDKAGRYPPVLNSYIRWWFDLGSKHATTRKKPPVVKDSN